MIKPTIKESKDLSKEEITELNRLSRIVNKQNPANHIQVNHIEKTQPTFYLFKNEGTTAAFQAFAFFKKLTPFDKREIPIIYINASYKETGINPGIKNYAKHSNFHYIKSQLGKFWFLKKFLVIYLTDNPKLFDRTSKSFYQCYPSYQYPTPPDIRHFCKQFVTENLKIKEANINENLVISEPYHEPSRITQHWSHMYKADDPKQNNFIISEKIIYKKEQDYFLSGKGILFVGCYSFSNYLRGVLKFKRRKNT